MVDCLSCQTIVFLGDKFQKVSFIGCRRFLLATLCESPCILYITKFRKKAQVGNSHSLKLIHQTFCNKQRNKMYSLGSQSERSLFGRIRAPIIPANGSARCHAYKRAVRLCEFNLIFFWVPERTLPLFGLPHLTPATFREFYTQQLQKTTHAAPY